MTIEREENHMKLLFICAVFLGSSFAHAASGGGGSSIGGGLLFSSSSQEDMDTLISGANARAGGISTKNFGSAYELLGYYQYRFSGTMFAVQFRPSYFTQSTTGSGTAGNYDYKLSGFTTFGILRLYALENSFMKFFLQGGVGYGRLMGEITEVDSSVNFAGGNFGALGGLGAEFCFTPNHCMVIEGNLRYLPIERNISTSYTNGASGFASGSVSQPNAGSSSESEVEINGQDLKTTMGGLQGLLSYTYNF
jgi:hypothetical protein